MKSTLIFALLAGVQSVQFVKEIKAESWYDKSMDAHEAAEEAKPVVNKFDGLVHGADGSTYDPATHKKIDREDESLVQVRFVKNMAQDGFDKSMDREQEMAKAPKVNKFDGLIHAQNGRTYDPVSMKEVVQEHSLLQTGDNYDETFE